MTYDDAEWHADTLAELDIPLDLANTHIGMYYAWARARGLASGTHLEHDVDGPVPDAHIALLDDRVLTPGAYLDRHLCSQLDPSFFTPEGARFTEAAYSTYLYLYDRPAGRGHGGDVRGAGHVAALQRGRAGARRAVRTMVVGSLTATSDSREGRQRSLSGVDTVV